MIFDFKIPKSELKEDKSETNINEETFTQYLIESNSTSSKRYKCVYCDHRDDRKNLIDHIINVHEDLIPEDYTATRIVFNMINKRQYGSCMICKGVTNWDENKGRYDSFCSDRCKAKYVEIRNERMMKVRGTTNMLTDEKHQEKMLANRSISGTYKFSTGGVRSYVGSYERKFLEFIDEFLHILAREIDSPGPTIPYKWKNPDTGEIEDHIWITDYYYIPFNLVFDIKDGGSNPNNRNMKSYRSKQDAKEKAIKELGTYNYIRLTDNNFEQLVIMFMELKERIEVQGINYKPIIKINEYCSPVLGMDADNVFKPNTGQNIVYFIPTIKDGIYNMGITKDLSMMNNIFPNEKCKLESHSIDYLFGSSFKTYAYYAEDVDIKYDRLLKNDSSYTARSLYEYFTEKDFIDTEQFKYDEELRECSNFGENLKMLESTMIATLKGNMSIPMIESTEKTCIIEYAQDIDGYYCYNKINNLRTKSYNTVEEIPNKVKEYISIGIL